MEFVLGIIYIMVAIAVMSSMAALVFRGPKETYRWIYLGCQTAVVVWCISQIFVLLSETTLQLAVSYVFGNLGICSIGAAWYYFANSYTDRRLNAASKWVPVGVAVFHYICVLTNPLHHMYYNIFDLNDVKHGIFFYTNVFVTYLFVIMGSVILYADIGKRQKSNNIMGENDSDNKSHLLIVASVLIPVFFNAVYLSGMTGLTYDITPLGFGISIIIVMFATMKYNFLDLNRELAITNEKLLLEKERNRIAQQVHDTAGHTLTMIQSYMKLAQVSNDKGDAKETGDYLSEARSLTSHGIKELREAINEMRQEENYELVTKGIMQLAGQVKEIPVDVTVKGEDSDQYSHLSKMLYDCTRESITNTLKYANASHMEIILRFNEDSVDLIISDDGEGCKEIADNNGLFGIRKRVEEAGGTVRFITAEREGFLTRIHVGIKKGMFV